MVRRVTIEFDDATMSFADNHKLMGALSVLEELHAAGLIGLRTVQNASKDLLRKPRADKKDVADRAISPQAEKVLKVLEASEVPLTSQQVSEETGVTANSIGGVMKLLTDKGLVTVELGKNQKGSRGRRPNLWSRAPEQSQDRSFKS